MLHERWPDVPRIALTATADRAPPAPRSPTRLQLDDARHFVASFDRPNIQYRIVPKDEPRAQLLALLRDRARRRRRHRLLPVRGLGREDRRVPRRPTASPRCRTTPAWTRATRAAQPGTLPARGRHGDGRDDRVRHGHRQARRALRRPPRPAEVRRGLLPGDRPRRPRRPAVHRLAGLRPAGRGAAAPDDRDVRRRPRPPPQPRRAPRRDARPLRDGALPPRPAARLLRRDAHGRLRQLRHLPDPAGVLGRHRPRPEAALRRLPPRPRAQPALRRRALHRHPARQADRQDQPARARLADRLRHRRRAERAPSGAASSGSCSPKGCSPSRATTARSR